MKKISSIILAIIGSWIFGFFPLIVFALTISPPVMELNANPGERTSGEIKIFNETDRDTAFYISTAGFTAKPGEGGEPAFFEGTDEEGLASWIEIEKGPIIVKPKEWQTISFLINVPKLAGAGGHYAAIFLGTEPGEIKPGEATIGIKGRVGTLVLLRVPGEIVEQGKLVEFGLADGKRVFERLPIDFSVRVENLGTVHIKPAGTIEIRNIFGRKTAEVKVNIAKMPDGKERPVGNILPKSIRKFESSWQPSEAENQPETFWQKVKFEKENFILGRYQAKLNLDYGVESDKKLTAVLAFWVFPWHLILVSFIVLALVLTLLVFSIRRYNRWIIKKARNNNSKLT